MTRDVDFYKKLLGASVVHQGSHESPTGTVKFAYLTLQTSPKTFEIHFVERPADPAGGMTIADLEGYYKAVHASAVRSPTAARTSGSTTSERTAAAAATAAARED